VISHLYMAATRSDLYDLVRPAHDLIRLAGWSSWLDSVHRCSVLGAVPITWHIGPTPDACVSIDQSHCDVSFHPGPNRVDDRRYAQAIWDEKLGMSESIPPAAGPRPAPLSPQAPGAHRE
jgi:hypothetical protein